MSEFYNLSDTAEVIDAKLGMLPKSGNWADVFETDAQVVPKLEDKLIDQAYNAESTKAQSGIAIDAKLQAIQESIQTDIEEAVDTAVANLESRLDNLSVPSFVAAASAPDDTSVLWIDTNTDGGLKYYNGSAWVTVPVRFS